VTFPNMLRNLVPSREKRRMKFGCMKLVRCVAYSSITLIFALVYLLSEGASLCETSLSASRLAKHNVAVPAQHHGLGVAKDCGNLKASGALDIHKERVGRLYEPLQLVCACFLFWGWVQEIDRHLESCSGCW